MRVHHIIAAVLGLGITAYSAQSSALMTVPGTTSDNYIFLGVAVKPSGASWTDLTGTLGSEPSGFQIWACRRGASSSSSAHWFYLGNPFSGLYDDTVVEANSGNDVVEVIRSSRYLYGTDSCDGNSYWFEAGQGTKFLDLHGGGGNDTLSGGDQNTWLLGEADDDTLYGYDTSGELRGGTGNDLLFSYASSEALRGDAGNDCVYDQNQNFTSANGDTTSNIAGTTDIWVDANCAGTSSFERRRTFGNCGDGIFTDSDC